MKKTGYISARYDGRMAGRRGSAMVETVILMPIYMILVFALIFFGYSTLAKQRARVTAHFTAMNPGMQTADELMPVYFSWNPATFSSVRPLPNGSEATAGDATLRVFDEWGLPDDFSPDYTTGAPPSPVWTGTTFDARRLTDYLGIAAMGEFFERFVESDLSGPPTRVVDRRDTFISRYLSDNQIVNQPPNIIYTIYTLGAAYAINNAHENPWLERRYSRVEYEYGPRTLRYVIGERPMSRDEYMGLQFPDPTFVPLYTTESEVLTRGAGLRRGTLEMGGGFVTGRMSAILQDGRSLPPAMTLPELDALRDILWPNDNTSLWVAQ